MIYYIGCCELSKTYASTAGTEFICVSVCPSICLIRTGIYFTEIEIQEKMALNIQIALEKILDFMFHPILQEYVVDMNIF